MGQINKQVVDGRGPYRALGEFQVREPVPGRAFTGYTEGVVYYKRAQRSPKVN